VDERFAPYDRQVRLLGEDGQRRLAAARVLVVGVGGLGCTVAEQLARAGVGAMTIMDGDRVAATDLHRQTLYSPADIGRLKAQAAAGRLRDVAPGTVVEAVPRFFGADDDVAGFDVVVDGTDDAAARLVLNRACAAAGIPWVHGALWRMEGQAAVFPPTGPCYRCLYPAGAEAPACGDAGVLGPVAALVASLQTLLVLEALAGDAAGRLVVLDATTATTETVRFAHRDGCPDCGGRGTTPKSVPPDGRRA